MWQWLSRLFTDTPQTGKSQQRTGTSPVPRANPAHRIHARGNLNAQDLEPSEVAVESHFPDPEEISTLFYQKLLNASVSDTNVSQKLTAPEIAWLKKRTEDLKETPTRLTSFVPRLPHILPKLMNALKDPSTPIRTLTELIESDAVIATQVLRLINSPAMRIRHDNITSIEQAVMLLGFSGMREVVAAAMFSPIAVSKPVSGINPLLIHDIWPVSLRAANALRLALKHKPGPSEASVLPRVDDNLSFELYLSVLLEHTGLFALLHQGALNGPFISPAYLQQFRALIPTYSARIAQAWGLPENTIRLICSPPPHLDHLRREARYFSLACVLNRRGYLDQAQFLHLTRALPAYTEDWYELCISAPEES
ncbi:MAG TPA: HDOD domain-containing protein [Halothiobacillus sp.]|nr:HDOD domain-containing protein [Halothiobacillus sp.]